MTSEQIIASLKQHANAQAVADNFLRRTNNIATPSTTQASRTNGMALSGGGAGEISKKTKTAPIMIVPSTGEMK